MVKNQEHRAAINAAGEADADGFSSSGGPPRSSSGSDADGGVPSVRCRRSRLCWGQRRPVSDASEPFGDFVRQCANVACADFVKVRRERVAARREKAFVNRVRVRAADQVYLDNMMGWHHPSVARMELSIETFLL